MGALNNNIGKIIVRLPLGRLTAGSLTVYHKSGQVLLEFPVLGKADNKRAADEGNPSRDSTRPYGDTPAGDYAPTGVVIFDAPHPRLGIGWIPLAGIFGDAWLAVERGRTGLGLHAGRGDRKLIPTYGCGRMRDTNFDDLAELLGDQKVPITVLNV